MPGPFATDHDFPIEHIQRTNLVTILERNIFGLQKVSCFQIITSYPNSNVAHAPLVPIHASTCRDGGNVLLFLYTQVSTELQF